MYKTTVNNNKRIAKNTLFLYVRMGLMLPITLYTSRIVLGALGVSDYGIYNVVGGVVSMFAIISGTLSASISRFITFELGKDDKEKLSRVFTTALNIQFMLAIIILIFGEIFGLWFIYNKMVIPEDRLYAATIVLQLSLITFIVNLISVPYNASIVAHERMSAFAYISVIEALAKLLISFLIVLSPIDSLIFYSLLLCVVAILVRFLYAFYCKRHFYECKYHFCFDVKLLKEMFNFAGWNFIGASSAILRDQGGNILLNIFYGPAVNASRAIAIQVNGAISSFITSFLTALNPQIIKSYASNEYEYMHSLMIKGARFSYYLFLFIALPVLLNTDYILYVWLGIVPEHSATFIQLVLIFAMSESISAPLITAMLATGRIRNYQIIVGGLQMLNFPLSYILLRLGFFPEIVFVVAILLSQCCFFARLYMLHRLINLDIGLYIKKVYLNVMLVTFIAIIFPIMLKSGLSTDLFSFLSLSIFCVFTTACSVYFVGCSHQERMYIVSYFNKIRTKFK